ncbi:hypothetical protein EDD21DRAFT_384537 [Dissophora ornata]|nr:hypothetical protein EDD21DRAFT_384537 [Dissophora ornata]
MSRNARVLSVVLLGGMRTGLGSGEELAGLHFRESTKSVPSYRTTLRVRSRRTRSMGRGRGRQHEVGRGGRTRSTAALRKTPRS